MTEPNEEYKESFERTWTRAELDERVRRPGKFEGETRLVEVIYDLSLISGQDDELGNVEDFGWFAKFDGVELEGIAKPIYGILSENDVGFVGFREYPSHEKLDRAWSRLENEYEQVELREED